MKPSKFNLKTAANDFRIVYGLLLMAHVGLAWDYPALLIIGCFVLVGFGGLIRIFDTRIFSRWKNRKFVCRPFTYWLLAIGGLSVFVGITSVTWEELDYAIPREPWDKGATWRLQPLIFGVWYLYYRVWPPLLSLLDPAPAPPKPQPTLNPNLKTRVVTEAWWAKYH